MPSLKPKKGRVINHETPVWEPLFDLAPELLGDFIWMYEAELEDGARLHAYEHLETQRHLHLAHGGRAFVFTWGASPKGTLEFEEVAPWRLLRLVLEGRGATIVGQNSPAEFRSPRWTRSATRHRISRQCAHQVIANTKLVFEEDPPAGASAGATTRLVFLGTDAEDRPLEVMAVRRRDGSLLVIHAMELRKRYRQDYEEARKWRR